MTVPVNQLSGPVLASVSRVWLQVAGVALILATSATVTPSEFGQFAIASSVFMFASVLVGHGLYEYILKGDYREDSPSTSLIINLLSATVLLGILWLSSLWIDRPFGSQHVGALLRWLAPVLFFQAFSAVLEPVLLRHARLAYVSASSMIAETLALITALFSLYCGLGVFALVVHKWVRELFHFSVMLLGRRWQPSLTFRVAVANDALRFASGIILSRLGTNVILYGAELIIGFVLSPAAAGLYRLANKVVSSVAEIILYALRMMLWVHLPGLQNNQKAFSEELLSTYQTAGVAFFALVAGVASISWIALPIFFDPEWHAAVPVIVVLAIARLVSFPAAVCEPLLAMRKRTDILFLFNSIIGVVSMLLLAIMGRYGLIWASFSQLLAGLVSATMAIILIVRFEVAQFKELLSLLTRLAVCAGAMAFVVVSFSYTAISAGMNTLLLLIISIGLGAIAYAATALFVAPGPAAKYQQIAKDVMRPLSR